MSKINLIFTDEDKITCFIKGFILRMDHILLTGNGFEKVPVFNMTLLICCKQNLEMVKYYKNCKQNLEICKH